MATNTIKTRIQLKNDTEAHWNLAVNFVPKEGEVIIYSADDTHPFSRLKVGDGTTNVVRLPFIDSGSVGGFVFREQFSLFPSIGYENELYVDVANGLIYKWTNSGGYSVKYEISKQTVQTVNGWNAGVMTQLNVDDNATLVVENGSSPTLQLSEINVMTGIVSID